MGKSQKKKAMRRRNPMRVPDSHLPRGLASASSSSTKAEAILPIIQKMESSDAAERKWACVAVSNLIQNDSSTRRLLQGKNVVGALICRLSDNEEEEVVVEAAGALRNLCIDGGYEICAEMYNKNILPQLHTFVSKISNKISQILESPSTAPENAHQVLYEFADNFITILWCLSESSTKALNAVNQMGLVPFLMSFLTFHDKLPLSTVIASAQCLYVLTDDNLAAINDVRSTAAYISCLLSISKQEVGVTNRDGKDLSERLITLRVLVYGILRNLLPIPLPAAASFVDVDKDIVSHFLQPVISSISLPDASNAAQELASRLVTESQTVKRPLGINPSSDHKSATEVDLERLENKLRTVGLALEILTGICATLPDADTEALRVEGKGEDADVEDALDVDMPVSNPERSPPLPTATLLPALVQPLLALVRPTPLSFPPLVGPSPNPPITSALSAIHVCALECLNNVFFSLTASPNASVTEDSESGLKVWQEVWGALGDVGMETGPGQDRRREMWEVAVGVLWGIGNVWKGSLAPNEDQVRILMQLCDSMLDPRIRVKCIGTLECLAQHPSSIEGNRMIASYLLSMLPSSTNSSHVDTEPLIQAVSGLIDIYSDENLPYDVNFRQGHFVEKLAASVDGIRKAVKAIDRRKEGGDELRRHGEEVQENFEAFIQYRNDLGL